MVNVFLNEENQRIEQFFCGLTRVKRQQLLHQEIIVKSVKYFALYVDKLMCTLRDIYCNEVAPLTTGNRILDEALLFFRFTRERDLFEVYCRQHLAKRLLFKSNSDKCIQGEKDLITKIEVICLT